MLTNKNIVVGVCGGIAAYKACEVVSGLKKLNANVDVIMTKSATKFVAPLTFETLSKNCVSMDMFSDKPHYDVEHISLAKKADMFLVLPATANIIGKFANGIADDMLSTTLLATRAPIVFCAAMNTNMYENVIVQNNIEQLKNIGINFIEPEDGFLACGDTGKGRMAAPQTIIDYIVEHFSVKQDFSGKNILITAGATIEPIDGVRYITNYSSGKMGVEIAKAASSRGAVVTLVCGNVSVPLPNNIKIINVNTTNDMYKAVLNCYKENDVIIKAAAPADYAPISVAKNKIKAEKLVLEMRKNIDIAKEIGLIKGDRKLVVFCAETENLINNALLKLRSKNADMIIANDVTQAGAGFNVDTNIVTIIDGKGNMDNVPLAKKSTIANIILDKILAL